MGRRLRAAVHLVHPVTHEPVILLPGDEPDEDLTELLTHPEAWEEAEAAIAAKPASAGAEEVAPEGDDPDAAEPEPEDAPAARPRRRKSQSAE
ncbi:hypothetical protein [Streptomyces sp. NPDC053367]|uniref:hypothetical protein n=1 Tax=Streptomyces sp. NPDC053367 TaxID=3365700 RepID=UPI0037D8F182